MLRDNDHHAGAKRPGVTTPARIDPRWLSETIGSIYDCVLAPERWRETIAAIAREFRFISAILGVFQHKPHAHELAVQFGFDDEWLARGNAYAADTVVIWGGLKRIEAYPLDEPVLSSQITPFETYSKLAYYREVLGPRGMLDAMMIPLARGPEFDGYFALNRHQSEGPIRPREIEGLRLIAPHLRRAVTISNLFDLKGVERATFRSVLDSMACAVILVDQDLGIVHANHLASVMIGTSTAIEAGDGRLRLTDRTAHDALGAAVRLAAENEALLTQRGIGIPVASAEGAPAVLHVLPLRQGTVRGGIVRRAVAAIFVASAGVSRSTPVDAISMLYDLTPAESQIFAAISRGQTLADAAEALGIAKSTTRTHLLRIFDKTGCKRQAELVELASRLSLSI